MVPDGAPYSTELQQSIIERIRLHASVCAKSAVSVDGVCGGTFARGNCMIVLRLVIESQATIESDAENYRVCRVKLKLMIIVCHLFTFNWVCNRNKWAFL